MHASIWTFRGDPEELLRSYDAMLAEIPRANRRLHLCLRAREGMIFVDTCPTKENFEAFARGDTFRLLRAGPACPNPNGSKTSLSISPSWAAKRQREPRGHARRSPIDTPRGGRASSSDDATGESAERLVGTASLARLIEQLLAKGAQDK